MKTCDQTCWTAVFCLAAVSASLTANHVAAFTLSSMSSSPSSFISTTLAGRSSNQRGLTAASLNVRTLGLRTSTSKLHVSTDRIAAAETTTDKDKKVAAAAKQKQPPQPPPQSKLRRLKDRMWVRETLEDLTAADFAASLEAAAAAEAAAADEDEAAKRKKKKQKRAVDVENILSKLDRRVEEMCVLSTYGDASGSTLACYPLDSFESSSPFSMEEGSKCYALIRGEGMGSVVYSDEQRDALLTRIFASRQRLLKAIGMGGTTNGVEEPEPSAEDLDEIRLQLQANQTTDAESSASAKSAAVDDKRKKKLLDIDPNLYVRDDGTIDWDGALQDSAALKKFGSSVWARINGQDPENIDEEAVQKEGGHGEERKAITAKIVETEEIREKKVKLDELQKELRAMTKEHRALLNSAVDAGSAVGNVNLATLDPALRSEIRLSAEALEKKEELVSCQLLIYELERIYTYLDAELGNTVNKGYIPLQDRLNVAEFGLLESQISSFEKQLAAEEYVDTDVLAVVLDQVTDFKRRLGIDYYVTGLTFDREAI